MRFISLPFSSFSTSVSYTHLSLVTIRKLKEKNVAVVFEKEGINTLEGTGEILISLGYLIYEKIRGNGAGWFPVIFGGCLLVLGICYAVVEIWLPYRRIEKLSLIHIC